MSELAAVFIGMVLINNFILVRFLGLCPFFGVSKKITSAISMGVAVTFVMAVSSVATWLIRHYILVPYDIEYMDIVIYILVIATLVQILELFIKKTNANLYFAFGIYLPLITTNCAVLGITLINATQGYSFTGSVVAALGGGLGFTLVLAMMSGIREKLELANIPKSMKGLPIAFFTAMLLGLAFQGFGGML
ncbi:MAG: RnfABCDGE type electron transport complex subunit A [Dehalococcoidales bacterium]|nr:RnfABCDGE type electron transport complex subunit A [Dehalococcoidales bacterium]